MLQLKLPKEFASPLIRRPVSDDIKFWISGGARSSDNFIEDLSNDKKTGKIVGCTWERTPLGHSALSFDGVDDYIKIPSFERHQDTRGTIELWFKRNNDYAAGSGYEWLMTYYEDDNNQIEIYLRHDDGSITCQLLSSGVQAVFINSDIRSWTGGKWYHIVVTQDGITSKMYVNGVEQTDTDTGEWFDDLAAANSSFYIGNEETFTTALNGSIDEFRIYNRALSSAEIKQRYENNKYLFGY